MTDTLQDKFDALEEQLTTQHVAIISLMTDIETTLELLNNNASLNTQRLLAALGQFGACAPCPTPPLTVPVTDPTAQTIDEDHCKRMQALIHAIDVICVKMDLLSAFSVGFSPSLISDALTEVLTELGSGVDLVLPSWLELLDIAGQAIRYVAENSFIGTTLTAVWTAAKGGLLDALYNVNNAAAGQSLIRASVDAQSSIAGAMLDALIYNTMVSVFFDPSSDVDLTGYDGSACSFVWLACSTLNSSLVDVLQHGDHTAYRHVINWPEGAPTTTDEHWSDYTYDAPVVLIGDYYGWTVEMVTTHVCRTFGILAGSVSGELDLNTSAPGPTAITFHSDYLVCDAYPQDDQALTIHFCQPPS